MALIFIFKQNLSPSLFGTYAKRLRGIFWIAKVSFCHSVDAFTQPLQA
jgi:hypothetical protein